MRWPRRATTTRSRTRSGARAEPGFDDARLDLIELLLANNQVDAARAETERLSPQTVQNGDPRYQAIKTRFDALDATADLPPTDALEARIAANPADLDARFDLAQSLMRGARTKARWSSCWKSSRATARTATISAAAR